MSDQSEKSSPFQEESRQAINNTYFVDRHHDIVRIISNENSNLAIKSLQIDEKSQLNVKNIFTKAVDRASGAFSKIYTKNLSAGAAKEARNMAPEFALEQKNEAYKLFHPDTSPEKIAEESNYELNSANLSNVASITKNILASQGIRISEIQIDDIVNNILADVEASKGSDWPDYLYEEFDFNTDKLKDRLVGSSEEKSGERDLNYIEVMLRLANSTWAAGQPHRAKAETSPARLTRDTYLPFDEMIKAKYEGFIGKEKKPDEAFSAVVYTVFKDLYELQKAQNQTKK